MGYYRKVYRKLVLETVLSENGIVMVYYNFRKGPVRPKNRREQLLRAEKRRRQRKKKTLKIKLPRLVKLYN